MQNLPAELRYSIFKMLARSLHFYFPRPDLYNTSNALGFLSACRLFHTEASPHVLPNATFHCRDTEDVMDLLSSLTKEQIGSIRHLSLDTTPLRVRQFADADSRLYEFPTVLQLFPGLQLDTLVVWGHPNDDNAGHIENMVKTGNGYKELRYVLNITLRSSSELWQNFDIDRLSTTWDAFARKRDGPESGTCINAYIATANRWRRDGHVAFYDDTWQTADQETLQSFLRGRDDVFNSFDSLSKYLVVVVKRGDSCDYVEHGNDLPLELKVLSESRGWWPTKAAREVELGILFDEEYLDSLPYSDSDSE